MIEDEPNLVASGNSRHVIINGFPSPAKSTASNMTRPGPLKWSITKEPVTLGITSSLWTRTPGIQQSKPLRLKAQAHSPAATKSSHSARAEATCRQNDV